MLLIATLIVWFLVREEFKKPAEKKEKQASAGKAGWLHLRKIWPMLFVSFLITFSMMMVDPLMSVYVSQLAPNAENIALIAGIITACTGVANILFAPRLGKLGDRIGYKRVLIIALLGASFMYLPQAFVTEPWQLMVCRFGLGMCMGGLMPQVNSLIRSLTPSEIQGRIFGFSTSAMFIGNLLGPNVGGFIGGTFGMTTIFFVSSGTLLLNALWLNFFVQEPKKEDTTPSVSA
jgi:MFS family permease